MTVQRTLNQGAYGGNGATWHLSELLIDSCSWVVSMSGSGNGNLFSSDGDVFSRTSANPVIGSQAISSDHWGHGGCWMVLEDLNSRQVLLKRHATDGNTYDARWAVGYSKGGNFVGGSDVLAPTASDEEWIFTAAGSPAVLFSTGTTASLLQILADDAESEGGEYGFCLVEYVATNTANAVLVMDNIQEAATGDPHPLAFYCSTAGQSLLGSNLYNTAATNKPKAWVDVGGGSEQWDDAYYCWSGYGTPSQTNTQLFPGGAGVSKYDSYERGPFIPITGASVGGFLGYSRWFYWAGVERGYPNTGGTLVTVYTEEVSIRGWDGVTVPGTI